MAQIDLKNATIRIKDGYQKLGAVNLLAGYTAGASTMAVDGFTGAVVNGDTFLITGDATEYTVTAHSETLGNTTSVTFSPVLAANVNDNAVITVGPHKLEVKIGEGTLTYSEKKARIYTKDRGRLSTVRDGDEEPVDVRFDFIWEFLKASTGDVPTVEDVLKNRGVAATWITSAADVCEPYAVDIEVEYVPPCTTEDNEVVTLPDFRYEDLAHDLKAGTVAVTGKCNAVEATVVRVAA